MNRPASIFMFVLLGAFAVGVGVVPFYVLANKDRNTLSTDLASAKARADRAEVEKQQIAENANKRVKDANSEVARAQELVSSLKEEQLLIAQAEQLPQPGSKETRLWTAVVSIPQHVTLMVPKGSTVESDDGNALRIMISPALSDPYARGTRWLEVLPYDEVREQEFNAGVASSTNVTFIANDSLLTGIKGISTEDGRPAYVLSYRNGGEKKKLIILREIPAIGRNGAEKVLGTMEFAD
jgi:hypothetical protein